MKLSSDEALKMLDDAIGKTPHDGWIIHSKNVGKCAGVIAKELGLDVDKSKALGYIHDYGKAVGEFNQHIINGYNYMKKKGYDEEYCNICLTHSYLNNDVNCTGAGFPSDIPFRTNFIKNHKYTIYEKMITLCDLMCTHEIVTLDKRLIDIIIRRGAYANTQYHIKEAYKLKKYFDDLLGHNLYDLFPEIKERL